MPDGLRARMLHPVDSDVADGRVGDRAADGVCERHYPASPVRHLHRTPHCVVGDGLVRSVRIVRASHASVGIDGPAEELHATARRGDDVSERVVLVGDGHAVWRSLGERISVLVAADRALASARIGRLHKQVPRVVFERVQATGPPVGVQPCASRTPAPGIGEHVGRAEGGGRLGDVTPVRVPLVVRSDGRAVVGVGLRVVDRGRLSRELLRVRLVHGSRLATDRPRLAVQLKHLAVALVVAEPLDDVVLRPVIRPLVHDADGRDARRLVGAGVVVQDRLAVAPVRHKAPGVAVVDLVLVEPVAVDKPRRPSAERRTLVVAVFVDRDVARRVRLRDESVRPVGVTGSLDAAADMYGRGKELALF